MSKETTILEADLGQKLWELRKDSGMSRAAFCVRSGYLVSAKTLERFEKGESMPDMDKIRKLYAMFGITLEVSLRLSKEENKE